MVPAFPTSKSGRTHKMFSSGPLGSFIGEEIPTVDVSKTKNSEALKSEAPSALRISEEKWLLILDIDGTFLDSSATQKEGYTQVQIEVQTPDPGPQSSATPGLKGHLVPICSMASPFIT